MRPGGTTLRIGTTQPNVTLVTPVFNGAQFLGEAIESVLSQTYSNWRYLIVDNCSTDDTLAVARRYAARDARIRVVRTAPHLPIMQHWNRALALIAPDTVYTKELHADDILMPTCVAEMVALLEDHPTAAVAGSYILYGTAVAHAGVPFGSRLLKGRDVTRRTLLGGWYLFGSPSSIMVRTSAAREIGPRFYDETLRHADVDACYRLLENNDFGFIHQILSATRTHPASITSKFTVSYSTIALEHFCFLMRYGPRYFGEENYGREYRIARRRYRRQFARRLVGGGGARYWRFHRDHLAQFGYRLSGIDAAAGALSEIALSIADTQHAARSIRKLAGLLFNRARPGQSSAQRRMLPPAEPGTIAASGVEDLSSFPATIRNHEARTLER
jgi:glycosyltransferase involved in cell wall biosynthesis